MEQALLDEIKDAMSAGLATAIKPLQDQLGTLTAEVATVKATVVETQAKAAGVEAEQKRFGDEVVRRFPWGSGRELRQPGRAPAFVRPSALGDRPYSLAGIVRAICERDESGIALEKHISDQLKLIGFPHSAGRTYLVPLSANPDYFRVDNAKADELTKLLADCLLVDEDPEATFALMKAVRPGLARKAMDPMSDVAGGSLIPFPQRGELIDLLRASIVMNQVGAQEVALPPGGLDYPMEAGATTFARRVMGSQTAIVDSTPATGSIRLTPKELAGLVKIPNSLIRLSNPAVEAVVRRALAADASIACDRDYLVGGGGTAPLGILNYTRSANNTPTRNLVTLHNASTTGAAGDTFLPEDVQLMLSLVEEAPDPEGANAWIMYPRKFWNLANARADAVAAADGKGPFMFPITRGAMSGAIMKELSALPVVTSIQVPRDRVKGASGATLTVILVGNFRRFVIGRMGALELAASVDRGFELNETWVRAILYDDAALLHPESIVVADQLLM